MTTSAQAAASERDITFKPALSALWPNKNGMSVVLDLGANIECSSKNLFEFSIMGASLYTSLYTYKKPNKTERKGLVNTRVGQGLYRRDLLNKFQNKCAVTGAELKEILIASHIVPWKDSSDEERRDVNNGILLSPTYDALFDKHLISFDDLGSIIISSKIKNLVNVLGIDPNAKVKVDDEMKNYLTKHRVQVREILEN